MLPLQIINIDTLTIPEIRELIARVESIAVTLPQVEMPVSNYFSKGLYAREIFIPKDTFIVGKIHRFENFNILLKGKLTIFSMEGKHTVEAPFSIVSPAGVKRVAYAHEDSIWTVVHATEETDLDKIEEEVIVKNYEELDLKETECLGQ